MIQLILSNRFFAQFAVMLIVTVLAIRKGGGPERAAAWTILSMFMLDRVNHWGFGSGITLLSVDLVHATLDFFAAVFLVVIALRANRMYTLWIAGFQLISLSSHVARELTGAMSPLAYLIMAVFPSYLQILTLGLGLWSHRRRLQQRGPYKDWRMSRAQGARWMS